MMTPMMTELPTQLRILITGASSGIGRALAEHYAKRGHIVGAVARRQDLLQALAETYDTIIPIQGDVTDGNAIEQAIHRFSIEQGRLDIVYANAGIGQGSAEQGWDPEVARRVTMINVVGTVNTLAPAATIMVEQGFGTLVGISSLAGQTPMPCAAAYGASKAWMRFYIESLAMDLESYSIQCSVVMPGHVPTPMVDGAESELVSKGARRAATLIASKVADGKRVIRFPRKIAILSQIAAFLPASIRAKQQRKRLQKRRNIRHGN